jgi:hypothetical protein
LQKIHASANYNPGSMSEVGDVVVVLSGIDTLKQAIIWRREGRIARLLAGPNILVFPSAHSGIIAAPEVDYCVTPADWVCKMYEDDCPLLKGRCVAWPAGVDTEYWRPDPIMREPRRALIFDKQCKGPVGPVSDYLPVLDRHNYSVSVLAYGAYSHEEFLSNLRRASLMVGFVTDESQGIAWAEAWSVDVPTLLWFQDHDTYQGRTFASSTAPYLSSSTGVFFSSVAEFEEMLTGWENSKGKFSPRRWVLDNMSDEVCARQLCQLAGVGVP